MWVCGGCWWTGLGAPERPNILWLIAEDLGPHLSCYETAEVSTPNLDRMAREGVRFTRFYSGNVCSPSRSALMTGMYATTIGAHNHRSHRTDGYQLPTGVRVLTDWMRDAGYFTANVVTLPPACRFKGTGKTDWNFSYRGKPFDSKDWTNLKTHQPFYAQINFQETHRPYKAPKRADPAKVAIPPYYPDHPITRTDLASYLDAVTELDRKVGRVLEQLEKDGLAENTVVLFFGDNGQSHVRGKQFCYEEGLNVPLIVRWPKSLPRPKGLKPGSVDSRLLESIDLAPTALEIAGASVPPKMQGRPFWGPRAASDRKYVFGARDRCDETVMRIRTVRDERYRYIRNFTPQTPLLAPNAYKERQYPVWNLLKELHAKGQLTPAQEALCQPLLAPEELYDLQTDPFEIHNLASSSSRGHQRTLKRLRQTLEDWIRDTHDQGATFESQEVVLAEAGKLPSTARTPASYTTISISGSEFHINGEPTYKGRSWNGHRIEGLLLNSRMVQGIFDDRNTNTAGLWAYPDTRKWDPDRNTREFIAAMPEWRRHGLLAFTINLQGGSPQGYSREQPWHNSAFEEDGSLRADYAARLEKIIDRADELGMAVILGYFYFGQDQRLKDEAAVLRATDNATRWVLDHGWRNVLIEVNNECNVRYDHPILQPERVHELIARVKSAGPEGRRLLVGTSYGGGTIPKENVVRTADFLLMHGNGVSNPRRIAEMVRELRIVPGYTPKPILFNEDDHFDFDKPENNFTAAIGEYASWGYFDPGKSNYADGYQCPPVKWGINTEQKKAFFRLLGEISGSKAE